MKNFAITDIKNISIELTNLCNMTCDYCSLSLDDPPNKGGLVRFPDDLYLQIIDYAAANLKNLEMVRLTNVSEFFLTKGLTTFYLPELKKRGLNYLIATNGSVYPKDIEEYKNFPPKQLVIGVQTITEQQFLANTRLKGVSWDAYLDSVGRLLRFFYENCHSTLISIEVAYNDRSFSRKILGKRENIHIPFFNEQMGYLPAFVKNLSDRSGVPLVRGEGTSKRYSWQRAVANTADGRVVVGLKRFVDTKNFYGKIPTDDPPTCSTDNFVFYGDGQVKFCCIDFRHQTTFASMRTEPLDAIFRKYTALVDQIRNVGSPYECCRHCMGYATRREKFAKKLVRSIRTFTGK